ncbi:MAG: hypothetical protein ACW97P_08600 [Candidatus Hodarchaeales archaeon]|jgi:hypothetical protein
MSKKVEDFIEQAKSNITEDRAATKTLLMNLMKYMQTSDDRHREVGLVALAEIKRTTCKVGSTGAKRYKTESKYHRRRQARVI